LKYWREDMIFPSSMLKGVLGRLRTFGGSRSHLLLENDRYRHDSYDLELVSASSRSLIEDLHPQGSRRHAALSTFYLIDRSFGLALNSGSDQFSALSCMGIVASIHRRRLFSLTYSPLPMCTCSAFASVRRLECTQGSRDPHAHPAGTRRHK